MQNVISRYSLDAVAAGKPKLFTLAERINFLLIYAKFACHFFRFA